MDTLLGSWKWRNAQSDLLGSLRTRRKCIEELESAATPMKPQERWFSKWGSWAAFYDEKWHIQRQISNRDAYYMFLKAVGCEEVFPITEEGIMLPAGWGVVD